MLNRWFALNGAVMATIVIVPHAAAAPTVVDHTAASGLVATHNAIEETIPGGQELMTGGMGVGDFDRDGDQDLFWISGGTGPDKLFINQGDGTLAVDYDGVVATYESKDLGALRLAYAGVPESQLHVEHDIMGAFHGCLNQLDGDEQLVVLPTYTALLAMSLALKTR